MVSVSTSFSSKRQISAILLCGLTIFFIVIHRETIATSSIFTPYLKHLNPQQREQGEFWNLFRQDLDAYAPNVSPFTHPQESHLDISFNSSEHRSRPSLIQLSDEQRGGLRNAHSSFVERILHKEYALPYAPRTRGIVTTAGGPLLPAALVSILMLRQTGSNLPVEVFLSDRHEWDPEICDKILPGLNAKCLLLQDIFDYDKRDTPLDRYQYKIVSIIFSSFEEVMFMDSDCFPVQNPDALFDSVPFKSSGLVLWPDFWFPSESPLFFEIAGIPVPPVHEKASIESGVLLYSKENHENSLLLAAYYNYYGPEFYYSLQSQGNFGEGDKETFLWSAVVMNQSYYTVKTPVHALGYHTKSKEWRGSGMAQFDPIQDYNLSIGEQQTGLQAHTSKPQPFFVHANYPKLDPGQIFETSSFTRPGPTFDSDGSRRRIWHSNETDTTSFFGFDLERRLWETVKDVACTYEHSFISWRGYINVCLKAKIYWDTVFVE